MYTLEQLNDLEEIRSLRILYSHYYDGQDLEALCNLFAEDAVCDWDESHGGSWVGREKIRQMYQYWFEKYPGYYSVMHAVTNHWVELTGENSAKGRSFLLDFNFTKTERPNPMGTVGVYDDIYVKTPEGWKFQRVSLDFLWPQRHIMSK